jgi:hypothetical protein
LPATAISTLIFVIGIPVLRFFLPAAIILGSGVALVIHKDADRKDLNPNTRPGVRERSCLFGSGSAGLGSDLFHGMPGSTQARGSSGLLRRSET